MTKITRPALRYHGGKFRLAPAIIPYFPHHRIYVEPFGGAGSVLLRKPRVYAEVYNDVDGEVVNVFRVLRSAKLSAQLAKQLRLTPFSRQEFLRAYAPPARASSVERARLTITKSFMGFGSGSIHDVFPRGMRTRASTWRPPTGFRNSSFRSGTTASTDWSRFPEHVQTFCERLQGVVIENKPALEVIADHDRDDTLFFLDPPYLGDLRNANRTKGKVYAHDMTEEADHRVLAEAVHGLRGMAIICTYPCELYDSLYRGWDRVELRARADGAGARTEVLFISPAAQATGLFA